jgi:hypothetical protein
MKKLIKQLIDKHGGDRKRVAALLEVNIRYIYMLENGDRQGGKHLKKIAKMYL